MTDETPAPAKKKKRRPKPAGSSVPAQAAPARSKGAGGTLAWVIIGASALLLVLSKASCGEPANKPAESAVPRTESSAAAPAAAASQPAAARPAPAGEAPADWNEAQISWMSYDEGLAAAKTSRKPICLVLHTEWCPHCKNYRRVFRDPKVVETAAKFVMIHVDSSTNAEISKRYAPDGEYIPRTFFLSPDGVLDPTVRAPRPKFQYFYDEHNPASLLAGMAAALGKMHASR